MSPTDYNIKTAKSLVVQLEDLLRTNPKFDWRSADLIIRNLVSGMRGQLNVIEYLTAQLDMEQRVKMSNLDNIGVKTNVPQ